MGWLELLSYSCHGHISLGLNPMCDEMAGRCIEVWLINLKLELKEHYK